MTVSLPPTGPTTDPPGDGSTPFVVRVRTGAVLPIDDETLLRLSAANPDLRLERTAEGDLVLMSPTGTRMGIFNARLTARLVIWAEEDGRGVATDSSTGYRLPDGAVRAPDAAWIRRERIPADADGYWPVAPDFAVELISGTELWREAREKMQAYLKAGVQLGWLIDPVSRRVEIWRRGHGPEALEAPARLDGEPVLPGFVLDLESLWGM